MKNKKYTDINNPYDVRDTLDRTGMFINGKEIKEGDIVPMQDKETNSMWGMVMSRYILDKETITVIIKDKEGKLLFEYTEPIKLNKVFRKNMTWIKKGCGL